MLLVNGEVLIFRFYLQGGVFLLLTERIKSLAEPLGMTFASIERDIGIGRGTIRKWDINCPAADKLLRVANLLNTSIDFLLTGNCSNSTLSVSDIEWLSLIHQLPKETQYEFRGEIKGYLKRLNEESVAADEPLRKTGTDDLGK